MDNQSEVKRRKQKNDYGLAFKLKALQLLEFNEGNRSKTAKELGITRVTLRKWIETHGKNLEIAVRNEQARAKVSKDPEKNDEAINELIAVIKQTILGRMAVLIPEERNLDRLQKTFKTLSEADGTVSLPEGDNLKEQSLTLIQKLTQNFHNYEPKTPITIVGHSEEQA